MNGLEKTPEKIINRAHHTENDIEIVDTHDNSQRDRILSNVQHEAMRHEERMSHEATIRSKASTTKTVAILVIIALILGFGFWWFTHSIRMQDDIDVKVDRLIDSGKFDEARDEAKKLKSRGDTIWNNWQLNKEVKRLLKKIDRAEKQWDLENHITVGRSSSAFEGMTKGDAQQFLTKQGFDKKRITLTEIAYNNLSRKEKKLDAGTVIGIAINGDKRFKEKAEFSPNSVIEIYYTGKK